MSDRGQPRQPTVAILGVGEIGLALTRGLLRAGWSRDALSLAVRREERAREVEAATGVACDLSVTAALEGREVVVVAVKPQSVADLLSEVEGAIGTSQVVVSLAAGVPTHEFESALGAVPVVRAMPNTPSLVGEGMTGLAAGRHAGEAELELAMRVLRAVGVVEVLEESLLDAVTAVSGTGPAYAFLLAEALTEAGIREGLPRAVAEKLVYQTLRGAGALLVEGDKGARRLRHQVTSPGGTTAAAMHVLEGRGFRGLVEDAVRAAARRSRELGRSDDSD